MDTLEEHDIDVEEYSIPATEIYSESEATDGEGPDEGGVNLPYEHKMGQINDAQECVDRNETRTKRLQAAKQQRAEAHFKFTFPRSHPVANLVVPPPGTTTEWDYVINDNPKFGRITLRQEFLKPFLMETLGRESVDSRVPIRVDLAWKALGRSDRYTLSTAFHLRDTNIQPYSKVPVLFSRQMDTRQGSRIKLQYLGSEARNGLDTVYHFNVDEISKGDGVRQNFRQAAPAAVRQSRGRKRRAQGSRGRNKDESADEGINMLLAGLIPPTVEESKDNNTNNTSFEIPILDTDRQLLLDDDVMQPLLKAMDLKTDKLEEALKISVVVSSERKPWSSMLMPVVGADIACKLNNWRRLCGLLKMSQGGLLRLTYLGSNLANKSMVYVFLAEHVAVAVKEEELDTSDSEDENGASAERDELHQGEAPEVSIIDLCSDSDSESDNECQGAAPFPPKPLAEPLKEKAAEVAQAPTPARVEITRKPATKFHAPAPRSPEGVEPPTGGSTELPVEKNADPLPRKAQMREPAKVDALDLGKQVNKKRRLPAIENIGGVAAAEVKRMEKKARTGEKKISGKEPVAKPTIAAAAAGGAGRLSLGPPPVTPLVAAQARNQMDLTIVRGAMDSALDSLISGIAKESVQHFAGKDSSRENAAAEIDRHLGQERVAAGSDTLSPRFATHTANKEINRKFSKGRDAEKSGKRKDSQGQHRAKRKCEVPQPATAAASPLGAQTLDQGRKINADNVEEVAANLPGGDASADALGEEVFLPIATALTAQGQLCKMFCNACEHPR